MPIFKEFLLRILFGIAVITGFFLLCSGLLNQTTEKNAKGLADLSPTQAARFNEIHIRNGLLVIDRNWHVIYRKNLSHECTAFELHEHSEEQWETRETFRLGSIQFPRGLKYIVFDSVGTPCRETEWSYIPIVQNEKEPENPEQLFSSVHFNDAGRLYIAYYGNDPELQQLLNTNKFSPELLHEARRLFNERARIHAVNEGHEHP